MSIDVHFDTKVTIEEEGTGKFGSSPSSRGDNDESHDGVRNRERKLSRVESFIKGVLCEELIKSILINKEGPGKVYMFPLIETFRSLRYFGPTCRQVETLRYGHTIGSGIYLHSPSKKGTFV